MSGEAIGPSERREDFIYKASEWQQEYHNLVVDEALGAGAQGPGKALAVGTMIPTPTGWLPIEALVPGDMVFGADGKPCRVVWASPVWKNRPVCEVVFDDGSVVVADAKHEWVVEQSMRRGRRRHTVETAAMVDRPKRPFSVDVASALELPTIKTAAPRVRRKRTNVGDLAGDAGLAIDPWVLGVWLGDGTSGSGQITSADPEIIAELGRRGFPARKLGAQYLWGVPGLRSLLRVLCLCGNRRLRKHIPPRYLRASASQRADLLRGLVDTDGHIDRDGRCEISLCEQGLAEDVLELIRGLGFKATIRQGDATLRGRVVGQRWRMAFHSLGRPIATLPRKLAKVRSAAAGKTQWPGRKYVLRCLPADTADTVCIEVDSSDHQFLAGDGFTPTHNSLCLLNDCNPRIQREHFRCLAGTGQTGLVPERLRPLCEEYPLRWGYSQGWAIHFRRTRPMLNQTIARSRRIFLALDPGATYNSDDTTWTFSSGYRYAFGHCRNAGDWDIYLSNEYDWMGFDELPQFNQEQYDQLILRCRSGDPLLRRIAYIRAMGNPVIARELDDNFTVDDPGWVKREFIDPAPEGRKVLKREVKRKDGRVEWLTRLFVPATLYDNPDKEFVEVQERKLLGAPKHIRDAYLHGKWDVMVGSHFGEEWNARFHVIRPFRVPNDWPVFRSMDWGYKSPGQVMWWTMDPDENLICINEVRFKMKTPRDVCKLIEKYEKPNGWWKGRKSILSGPADTQLWEDRGDYHTMTKYQDFLAHGVKWVQADKKSRFRNAELVMERLTDHDNWTTTPGLVFVETCVHIIRTLPAIPSCKPPNQEMPQEGGDDHAYDATAYATAYVSKGRKVIQMGKREDDAWEEKERLPKPRQRGYAYGRL